MSKVNLKSVIDEMSRHLLVDYNAVVKRVTAKLSKPAEEQWLRMVLAKSDMPPIKLEPEDRERREIPVKYIFLDITKLTWSDAHIGGIETSRSLQFKLPPRLRTNILKNDNVLNKLPADIRDAIKTKDNAGKITLDMNKITVIHNKKDSWEPWALPSLYSVLADVFYRDKLRQADISALDGFLNVIRLWKLGDHTNEIFPTSEAIDKMHDILQSNTGGGALDIVWDSMVDMEAFYPPVDKILGPEKYEQVNKDILVGLGVPEILLGGKGANFSNSFIQLKTVVEKLESIRSKIIDWLNQEVLFVCRSLGIEKAPVIRANKMNMYDENTHNRLLVGLLDRGIISVESVLESYGEDFSIEVDRLRKETKELQKNGIKVRGPFKDDPRANGEGSGANNDGSDRGRPTQNKDTTTRDTRTPNPRTAEIVEGMGVINWLEENIIPSVVKSYGVENSRQLTNEQRKALDDDRLIILSCIKHSEDCGSELNILDPDHDFINRCIEEQNKFSKEKGKKPTVEEIKLINASVWSQRKVELYAK